MEKYLDKRMRIKEAVRSAVSKMSGSTVVEDPGIPLVNRANGKYSKYMEDDTSSQTSSNATGTFGYTSRFDNIGYRLSRRKTLFKRRRWLVDIEFGLAMLGIVIMLVETELNIAGVIGKTSAASIILKSIISVSTLMLLVAILAYHVAGIQIQMTDNGWEDWRLAMNFPWTYLKISLELLVCAIHPIPGAISVPAYGVDGTYRMVPLESIFSILMLLRLYIFGKFLVVHSRLLTDTCTQSLGALNKVKIDTAFVFKALMSSMPGTMLIGLMFTILVLGSWALRTCEVSYNKDSNLGGYLNSMWLVAISFLTIGYGDFTPDTYCGRFVSVTTGLMGVGTTALLVAVLAQKLEQSRSEKYVHNFVSRVQLDKARKHAASDVIKHALTLWKMKKRGVSGGPTRIRVYGRLLQSIYAMREAKNEKGTIGENAIGVVEVHKSVNDMYGVVEQIQEEQISLQGKIDTIEEKMTAIDLKLDTITEAISRK